MAERNGRLFGGGAGRWQEGAGGYGVWKSMAKPGMDHGNSKGKASVFRSNPVCTPYIPRIKGIGDWGETVFKDSTTLEQKERNGGRYKDE